MSRSSPGVARVAAILNFIADHPGQAFALTDLVRALKLSRATCHALLTGLVEVGYLYRTTDKTYVLGPALAAIGRTAADHFSPLQVAQPEMRSLADEFDVVCGAYFLEGDVIHLRERAASLSHIGYPVPLGTRMPLRWIQAITFFARSPRDADAWAGRADAPLGPDQIVQYRAGLEFVRTEGFAALIRRPGVAESVGMPVGTEDPPVVPLVEIDGASTYPLTAVMAPIYDSRGRVMMALVIAGFHGAMTGEAVTAAGRRLAQSCERISGFISGRAETA
ncbi:MULTISPECIES: IclR family transcriptional regulator [unclassified Novosphingobium]|uniref:IclR family transcriptional regulator n=1 Tax=unclassified Novosphingobium TaxID=2644732 RepID=UPI00135C287B|nr:MULTISPECIES: helix-turn-helix domain-containing protein [unclassified Novosphingobium]